MKRVLLGVVVAVLLIPAIALAHHRPSHPKPPGRTTTTTTTTTQATTTSQPSSTTTTTSATTTTTQATTTTTQPTTTTTLSGGFPDASNTGVPAGTVLTPGGSLTITTPGTVIDARDLTGTLFINADNVTVRRSRITSGNWWVVKIQAGRTGVVIEDCEIDGRGLAGSDGSGGIVGGGTFRRNNVHGTADGLYLESNSLVEANYIHGLAAPGAPHYDGIQITGGESNITVRGNTIINDYTQTAAFGVWNDFGGVSNVLVENNRLIGGGFTVYARGDAGGGGTVTGITIRNNRLGRGYWGYASIVQASVSWSGNVDDVTGLPVSP